MQRVTVFNAQSKYNVRISTKPVLAGDNPSELIDDIFFSIHDLCSEASSNGAQVQVFVL